VEPVELGLHRLGLLDSVEQQLEAHPRRLGSQKHKRTASQGCRPGKRAIDLDLLRIELRLERLPLMLTVQRRDLKLGHERPS
jgi:hypothetical protein